MWDDGKYVLFKSTKKAITSDELIQIRESWVKQYPIILLEDGMGENGWDGWRNLTAALGARIEVVGDDIFCTNPQILQQGIERRIGNAILIKLNQIGTVTETLDTIAFATANSYRCFVSHRFGRDGGYLHCGPDGCDKRRTHQDGFRLPERAGSEIQPVPPH
jgi:enolase